MLSLVEINSRSAFSARSLITLENTLFGCNLRLSGRKEANQGFFF